MNDGSTSSPAPLSPGKRCAFRLASIGFLVLAGSLLAEYGLRWRHGSIQGQDRLDPGLVIADSQLGWRLAPDWKGKHRHFDFSTEYSVSIKGSREQPAGVVTNDAKRCWILGDSFVFGLGVGDAQTFAHLLNASKLRGLYFENHGVPGYSTDQQSLLLEQLLANERPARVLLIAYLANDLLDNQYDFPLQLQLAKPRFELQAGSLALAHVPVVPRQKAGADARRTLMGAVLGHDAIQQDFWLGLEARSMLLKTVRQSMGARAQWGKDQEERLRPAVDLFEAIVERMRAKCSVSGVSFHLALLAGRSFVEEPGSLSARYQEYFRGEIARRADAKRQPILDLALGLKVAREAGADPYYFPHDGHLNEAGHRKVAELIEAWWPSDDALVRRGLN